MRNDVRCGFETVKARDIDRLGIDGIIKKLRDRIAGTRVYVSVDIDVLDPAFAPGKHTVIFWYLPWILVCVSCCMISFVNIPFPVRVDQLTLSK